MTVAIGNMTATWANTSNTFIGIGMNINASSYAASSRILNLQVSGNSVFNVSVSGSVAANSYTGYAGLMTGFTANVQQFDGAGAKTWAKPEGAYGMALVRLWAGGGSGGRGSSDIGGGGGGGGTFIERLYPLSLLGATEPITVGAGGASRTGGNQDGIAGGSTTFSSASNLLTAYGGFGGGGGIGAISNDGGRGGSLISSNGTDGPAGGTGVQDAQGSSGNPGVYSGSGGGGGDGGGAGGNSVYGGAGGGGGAEDSAPGIGNGGTSVFGGNGGAGGRDSNPATAGSVPGGGGGGSEQADSGAGADGRAIVITW